MDLGGSKFHRVCGKNIQLSEDNTVAERASGFENGVVYTEKPVPVGTMFQIELLQVHVGRGYSGSLALGFITVCPDTIAEVPVVYLRLRADERYWTLGSFGELSHAGNVRTGYSLRTELATERQSLGCMVYENGDLHYFIDGKDQGLAYTGLPTDQPLWGFVDIYAKAKEIKFSPPVHQCSNCLQLQQQVQQLRDKASEDLQYVQGLQQRLEEAEAREQQSQQQLHSLQEKLGKATQQLQQQKKEMAQQREETAARSQLQLQLLQQRLDTATAELERLCSSPQVASQQGIEAWKVPRTEVEILREMDRGAWGTVARGRFQGQLVAVKWPHPAILNEHTIERLRREVRIMAQVRHPNLLRFMAAVFDDQMPRLPPLIVMELLDTNLRTAYQNGRLSGDSKLPIFRDVAYALHYLHEHQEPIIHRDVSAPNVLLEELPNQMWRAKVSDFGSANLAKMAQTMGEGAIIYAAPETIPQTHYDSDDTPPPQTTKIDVFSYGVLLCEVITCQLPNPAQYRSALRQIQSQWQFMHELIVICTKRNPEERPTMARVLDKLNKLPRPRPQGGLRQTKSSFLL